MGLLIRIVEKEANQNREDYQMDDLFEKMMEELDRMLEREGEEEEPHIEEKSDNEVVNDILDSILQHVEGLKQKYSETSREKEHELIEALYSANTEIIEEAENGIRAKMARKLLVGEEIRIAKAADAINATAYYKNGGVIEIRKNY